ncbi:MAG: polysaccharide biosynthesis/export family protein [Spirochaetia bacterium]|nr:polysaccharide biosynthesis/export family protein [Spirochaetia bacterium]
MGYNIYSHPCENSYELTEEYKIGPQDVLQIKVWGNADFSGTVVVDLKGYIRYQFIGKIKANDLTTAELAQEITKGLEGDYLINPQVTVEVVQYRSQKISISGEVARPGAFFLTKRTTLVEAIAEAGGHKKEAGSEVIIVRLNKNTKTIEKEQVKIDLKKALEGDMNHNIFLKNGDLIFIPIAKTFYIMGEVARPGKYNLEKNISVLKAISLAGGETSKASINRTKIIRIDGKKTTKKNIELNEIVRPNDIIVVPESFF